MSFNESTHRTREDDFPAINISRIRVGGDLGGLIFVVGIVVCFLIGLPESRAFFVGTLAGGGGVAGVIWWWHRRQQARHVELLVALHLRSR
jgi:hypothetical protein